MPPNTSATETEDLMAKKLGRAASIASEASAAPGADSVAAFCRRYGIGRTKFYGMLRDGSGPRTMLVGGRRRVTHEAELDWQRAMEAKTEEAAR